MSQQIYVAKNDAGHWLVYEQVEQTWRPATVSDMLEATHALNPATNQYEAANFRIDSLNRRPDCPIEWNPMKGEWNYSDGYQQLKSGSDPSKGISEEDRLEVLKKLREEHRESIQESLRREITPTIREELVRDLTPVIRLELLQSGQTQVRLTDKEANDIKNDLVEKTKTSTKAEEIVKKELEVKLKSQVRRNLLDSMREEVERTRDLEQV